MSVHGSKYRRQAVADRVPSASTAITSAKCMQNIKSGKKAPSTARDGVTWHPPSKESGRQAPACHRWVVSLLLSFIMALKELIQQLRERVTSSRPGWKSQSTIGSTP